MLPKVTFHVVKRGVSNMAWTEECSKFGSGIMLFVVWVNVKSWLCQTVSEGGFCDCWSRS